MFIGLRGGFVTAAADATAFPVFPVIPVFPPTFAVFPVFAVVVEMSVITFKLQFPFSINSKFLKFWR